MRSFITRTLAATALVLAALTGTAQAEARQYILATATTGGTYYPVGVAIATLSKVKLEPAEGFSLSAISSAGSGENIKLLAEDEAQFAILQGLYGSWAAKGTGALEAAGPQEDLRAISMLWLNVEHFSLLKEDARTGTIMDLKGLNKPFSIGKRNSGSEGSARAIFAQLGIDPETDFDPIYLGYGPSADAIRDGKAVGMNTPAGVPVSAVTSAFAANEGSLVVLNFTDEQVAKVNEGYDLWSPYTIPAGTYPGQTEDFHTIAQPNFLAVRGDVSEEDVHNLTRALYENLPFLNNIHAATKAMSLGDAIRGLPLPLHPGARRYYEEQGASIPARLIAEEPAAE